MPITFCHLGYIYSPHSPFEYDALKDISLTIKDHSFSAIVGHTGSGKSTLIQQINALLLPTSGSVAVFNMVVTGKKLKTYIEQLEKIVRSEKTPFDKQAMAQEELDFLANKNAYEKKALRKKVGIVFQFPEYQLFEETVEKDVSFGPINFGATPEEALKKAHQALARVGIDESYYTRSPFELSGGERRRVAIAGIIAMEPDILILDEPTAGLDPLGASSMMHLFKDIHKAGATIVLVTHDMDLVMQYATDVVVMKDGQVKEVTTPIELFTHPKEDYALEIPLLYQFALALQKRGFAIDLSKVKVEDDLVQQLKSLKESRHE